MSKIINVSHSSNLLPFLNYFEKNAILWKEAAKKHHFPEDIESGDYWLPSHQVMGFLSTMMRSTKQRIGLDVGRLITIAQISPELEAQVKYCVDLDAAVHLLIESIPTLSNHVVIWPEKIEGKWYLCHRGAYHPSLSGYDQAEWFRSFALLSLCRQFLGETWQPQSVFMSFSEHLAQNLPASFAATEFVFSHAFGAIEIPLSDDFVPIERNKIENNWQNSIHVLIDTYATLPWFNVAWLATFASTSARTLQRRFNEQGISFRGLRDQTRCKKALQLLKQKFSPYEIAWQCGYTDLSNFNRAFKGWTGETPSQYQKKIILDSPIESE